MGLPPRSYFYVEEIAKHWDAQLSDLAAYARDGLLEICIMTTNVRTEAVAYQDDEDDIDFEADEDATLSNQANEQPELSDLKAEQISGPNEQAYYELVILDGPNALRASDVWEVFHHGSLRISNFASDNLKEYLKILGPPIRVALKDLLITRTERDRFELRYDINIRRQNTQKLVHQNNYTRVAYNGEIFKLGFLQADVVRQLHEAAQSSDPWRSGKQLLGNAKAQTSRMVDLFKSKPTWRNLIDSDRRGYFRLKSPD